MIVDAVVLAGGRSARLGGVPKAGLVVDGRTLLEHALEATAVARRTVVVGDPEVVARATSVRDLTVTREQPAFAGPAAAIGAGVAALEGEVPPCDLVLVLACDMPGAGAAVAELRGAAGHDGAIAVDASGRRQPLLALYPAAPLRDAVARAGSLENLSVRELVAGFAPVPVAVPAGSTDDIDTWDDAEAHGVPREGEPA